MVSWKEDFLAMTRNRVFCLGWLVFGMVYLVSYMFILDPVEHTISMIGLEHPWLFRLWGLVAATLAVLNSLYLMRRYEFKSKVSVYGLIIGCVSIALSVNIPTTDDWGWRLVGHWGTAIIFGISVMVPAGLFLLEAAYKRKSRRALVFLILAVPTTLAMLTWLILDKGGIAQAVMMAIASGALFLLNYTNFFKDCMPEVEQREEVEARG